MADETNTATPVELSETATDEVQGGPGSILCEVIVSSAKGGPKKGEQRGFLADSVNAGMA